MSEQLNSGLRHISKNLSMFGFGNPESAIVQSAKELIENGIDACKEQVLLQDPDDDGKIKRVKVSLRCSSSFLILEVEDEGTGMCLNPPTFLDCFQTSKDAQEGRSIVNSTGRFGVGLTACLVYSMMSTDKPIRIVSKTMGDAFSYGANIGELKDMHANAIPRDECVIEGQSPGASFESNFE
jgi:DNA topoisomerase VI subunit B